jgi:hypothetical protein
MMNWIDLTDTLFYRAFDHIFMIQKPRYRNDVVEWSCFHKDTQDLVASGKTVRLAEAKTACKEVCKQIKGERRGVFIRKNNKLKVIV